MDDENLIRKGMDAEYIDWIPRENVLASVECEWTTEKERIKHENYKYCLKLKLTSTINSPNKFIVSMYLFSLLYSMLL